MPPIEAGKHVLVEKPAARSVAEIDPVIEAARRHRRLVRVGFNHRYHPALRKARELVDAGALGELMFVRGRYGHGGRVGYDREWRADPASVRRRRADRPGRAPDRSVALVSRRLHHRRRASPTPTSGRCRSTTTRSCCCGPPRGQAAFLHVSCTEWKNLFSFEIYGRDGKLQIEGLGGSYGVGAAHALPDAARRWARPRRRSGSIPRGDESWALEFAEFLEDIRLGREPAPGLADARAALAVVEEIYRQSGLRTASYREEPAGCSMIITRSPLRITLGGGGTDLPSYYREHERLPDRRRHRQIRLRDGDAAVHARHLPEVLQARARRAGRRRRSTRSSARRSGCSASGRRRSRSRRWPTFRPAPASARPAASPRRC